MSNDSERAAFDFGLELRGDVWVTVFAEGGVRPSTEVEVALWKSRAAIGAQSVDTSERAAFEASDSFRLCCLAKPSRSDWLPDIEQYNDFTVQMMWESWQARAALSAQSAEPAATVCAVGSWTAIEPRGSYRPKIGDALYAAPPQREGWVSVEDRLPQNDGWYWCWVKNSQDAVGQSLRYYEWHTETWQTSWTVTYWMPPPQPSAARPRDAQEG